MSGPIDPNTLTYDNINHLTYIVNSPSWLDFFEPMLKESMNSTLALLADPSIERKNSRPDDFLRGQIVTIRNFLSLPHFIISEHREREMIAKKEQEERAHYEGRAEAGTMAPMGFREVDVEEF